MSSKHKPGDNVRITRNTCYHAFNIGDLITISEMTDWGSYFAYCSDGYRWAFDDDDCEVIQGVLQ